jgi:hypothetical protein
MKGPASERKRDIVVGILVAALVLLAFYLRSAVVTSGIPGVAFLRQDEVHYVRSAIACLNGDFSPDQYVNPSLYNYLHFAAITVVGWIQVGLGQHQSFADYALELTLNPYGIILIGRLLSIAAATASVAVAFLVARQLTSTRAALVSAAALALNVTHVFRSELAGNEVTMVLLVLLFFAVLVRYLRKPGFWMHAASGLVLGLAASTKYNAAIHLVALVAVTLIVAFRDRRCRPLPWPSLLVGFFVVPIGFLLGTPYILGEVGRFFADFGTQYSYLSEAYSVTTANLWGFSYYPLRFPDLNNGLPFALLCGAGVLMAAPLSVYKRSASLAVLLLAALPLYLFLGTGVTCAMRFLLPALPFILMLGGWASEVCLRALAGSDSGSRRARLIRVVGLPLALVVFVPGLDTNWSRARAEPDPRQNSYTWIHENLSPGDEVLELAYPMEFEFPDSLARDRWFDYRPEWFTSPGRRVAFEEFRSQRYSFTSFESVLQRADNLEELLQVIKAEGYRYLVLSCPSRFLHDLKNFPAYTALRTFRECAYWPDLAQALLSQPPQQTLRAGKNGWLYTVLFQIPELP